MKLDTPSSADPPEACGYDSAQHFLLPEFLVVRFLHSHNFLNMPPTALRFHRTLVFGIWARKLCDIYSSIGCALSFRPSLDPLDFC